jgi:hypothetical protein
MTSALSHGRLQLVGCTRGIAKREIPRFIPHTNPTPPDETDTTGREFVKIPDDSDITRPFRQLASTS